MPTTTKHYKGKLQKITFMDLKDNVGKMAILPKLAYKFIANNIYPKRLLKIPGC